MIEREVLNLAMKEVVEAAKLHATLDNRYSKQILFNKVQRLFDVEGKIKSIYRV